MRMSPRSKWASYLLIAELFSWTDISVFKSPSNSNTSHKRKSNCNSTSFINRSSGGEDPYGAPRWIEALERSRASMPHENIMRLIR
jgi:hypothetical protein